MPLEPRIQGISRGRQTLGKYLRAMTEMTKVTKPRWTVRSVSPGMIQRVRSVQDQTGAGLGEIVSLALAYGLGEAKAELARRQPRHPNKQPLSAVSHGRGRNLFNLLVAYGSGGVPRRR